MRALELNLATRPFKNNTLLWFGYGSAAILLVLFTIFNVLGYRSSHHKLSELSRTMVNIEQENLDLATREERARREIGKFDLEFLERQAGKANEVIEWKAFSWTRLFNRMAQIQPHQVKMVSIRPVLRSAVDAGAAFTAQGRAESVPVLVEGIARNFGALWEFQNVLMAAPHFGRVAPERLTRGEQNEVVFQLRFEYYPIEDEGSEVEAAEGTGVTVAAESTPVVEAEPAAEPPAEPAAAEPPRRQLPPVVGEDGEAGGAAGP